MNEGKKMDVENSEATSELETSFEYTLFHTHREALWAWMKGKPRQLSTLVKLEHVLPDVIQLQDFSSLNALLKRDITAHYPSTLDVSNTAFPILEIMTARDLCAYCGIHMTEVLMAYVTAKDDVSLFGDNWFTLNEHNYKRSLLLKIVASERYLENGNDVGLLQLNMRLAAIRLFELINAYDFFVLNEDRIARLLKHEVWVDTFGKHHFDRAFSSLRELLRKQHFQDLGPNTLLDLLWFSDERALSVPEGPTDWYDYENQCATLLKESGFEVGLTNRTGDFGADIVVVKHDLTYVVQCKWHGKPIGVKAIQEVHASRAIYGADYAVVVAETGFTSAARELAGANAVALLSVAELALLEEHFN